MIVLKYIFIRRKKCMLSMIRENGKIIFVIYHRLYMLETRIRKVDLKCQEGRLRFD